MKKKLIIVGCIIICLVIMRGIFMYCLGYRIIPVKYVTYLDTKSISQEEYFYAMFTVETAREWIQDEGMHDEYYQPEKLVEELNKLDDNQRIVLGIGKRIKYFYYWDEGSSPSVYAVYYNEPLTDNVYFYTVDYNGAMIDHMHH